MQHHQNANSERAEVVRGRDRQLEIVADRDARRCVRLASGPRRPDSALRSTRFHIAEPGLNAILATQDAAQTSASSHQTSCPGHPDVGQAAQIRRRGRSADTVARDERSCQASKLTKVNLDNRYRLFRSVLDLD